MTCKGSWIIVPHPEAGKLNRFINLLLTLLSDCRFRRERRPTTQEHAGADSTADHALATKKVLSVFKKGGHQIHDDSAAATRHLSLLVDGHGKRASTSSSDTNVNADGSPVTKNQKRKQEKRRSHEARLETTRKKEDEIRHHKEQELQKAWHDEPNGINQR